MHFILIAYSTIKSTTSLATPGHKGHLFTKDKAADASPTLIHKKISKGFLERGSFLCNWAHPKNEDNPNDKVTQKNEDEPKIRMTQKMMMSSKIKMTKSKGNPKTIKD